ncbi:MAG: DUF1616 domain-containing protein [Candidatus Bathyarchaeia archaeon]
MSTVYFVTADSPIIILRYVRYVFGFIFVAFLPGYCLTEFLFSKRNKLDLIETAVLSVALSFSLFGLCGLFLGLSPIGIRFESITVSSMTLVLVLAVLVFIRKRNSEKSTPQNSSKTEN